MEIAITGSSGLIGTRLQARLAELGHRPVAVVRRETRPGADEIRWQPDRGQIDADALEGMDGVVNLAGAGIGDKRWTEAYKRTLVDSRIDGTKLLAATLAAMSRKPSVLLSGSAIGYYGNRGAEQLTESSSPGDDFLAGLCVDWEAAADAAASAGVRTVLLRTGIVLDPAQGALAKLLPLFKFGLGGRMGSGHQYMSWITLDDHVEAMVALLTSDISGPVNLTAPAPVTNREFTSALGEALGRPTLLPIPSFGPKLVVGPEMAQALLFHSQRVIPKTLLDSGHGFASSTVDEGLAAVLGTRERA